MAAGARLVQHPDQDSAPARVLVDKIAAVVCYANSDADAIAVAQAQRSGDVNAAWAAGTVTVIAGAANMIGWRLNVKLTSPLGVDVVDVTVVGAGSDDTVDEIAALAVIALNATAPIAGAAYNSGTQVLKIAETTDGLGDHIAHVSWFPPAADVTQDVAIPGFLASKSDGGSAGSAVTATFAADGYTVPKVFARMRYVP